MQMSTAAVPPPQRIAYWKDAICAAFVHLELECDPRLPFSSELAIRSTGRFDLIDVAGSPQHVYRSARLVEEDPSDSLIIMLQQQGEGRARQGAVDARMAPGSLTVLDSRRAYALQFATRFRQTVIKAPVAALEQRLGSSWPTVGQTVDGGTALGRLACMAVDELGHEARASVTQPLSTIALDLLALALLEGRGATTAVPPMATLRVCWAKAQVLESLRDPLLSPLDVARRQGVSLRLLQRLFAAEGASLSDFIVAQRLSRCEQDLRDPAQAGRSITDIALSWGFADSGRFAKAFRRRFGVSPTEARRGAVFAGKPKPVR
jgi:AraC-like DNA-binding protein